MVEMFIFLVVLGVIVWAITSFIPMDPTIAMIIRVVGIIVALLYVLSAFGVMGNFAGMRVPRLR